MASAIDNHYGSLRMRTRGEGGLSHCVRHVYRGRGSENSDFGAYVLNGRSQRTERMMRIDNTGESMNLINWKCIVLKNHRCNWLKLRTEEAS